MSQKMLKFGSADLINFIEIYRSHECLWDTENPNYKSRDARNAALGAFALEFGVEGFGPKEITNKIKNLRTQYHAERKKVLDSMDSGSGTEVFKSKLFWYDLMDSFLDSSSEHREWTSKKSSSHPGNCAKYLELKKIEDDLEHFGKYVASSLGVLKIENRIHAQDEIQAVLSKYKLLDLKQNKE